MGVRSPKTCCKHSDMGAGCSCSLAPNPHEESRHRLDQQIHFWAFASSCSKHRAVGHKAPATIQALLLLFIFGFVFFPPCGRTCNLCGRGSRNDGVHWTESCSSCQWGGSACCMSGCLAVFPMEYRQCSQLQLSLFLHRTESTSLETAHEAAPTASSAGHLQDTATVIVSV